MDQGRGTSTTEKGGRRQTIEVTKDHGIRNRGLEETESTSQRRSNIRGSVVSVIEFDIAMI